MKRIILILLLSLKIDSNCVFSINKRNIICNEIIEDLSINLNSGEINIFKIDRLIYNLKKILELENMSVNIYFLKFSSINLSKILKLKDLIYSGLSIHLNLKLNSFSIAPYFLYKKFRTEIIFSKKNGTFFLSATIEYLNKSNYGFKFRMKQLKIANVNEIIYFKAYKQYKNYYIPEASQSQEEKDKILLEVLKNPDENTDYNISKFNKIRTTLSTPQDSDPFEYFESFKHTFIVNEILKCKNNNIKNINKDLKNHIELLYSNFSSIHIRSTNKENDINPDNWWFKVFW